MTETVNGMRIRLHSFQPHRRAVQAIDQTLQQLDRDLRSLARRQDLYPGEKTQRQLELRRQAEAQLRQHRRELADHITASKALANFGPPAPSEQEHRLLVAAQAEVAGLLPDQQLEVARQAVATGDMERARAVVRAARPALLNDRDHGVEFRRLELACERGEVKVARAFGRALEAYEGHTAWLDEAITDLLPRAGIVSPAVRDGMAVEEPLSTRAVGLWADGAEKVALRAFQADDDPGQGRDAETADRVAAGMASPGAGS